MLKEKGGVDMKVLSIGKGVIGTTYLWQLANNGCEARVVVRKDKYEICKDNGIKINYIDKRDNKRVSGEELFKPHVYLPETVPDDNDLIIVSVQSHQLEEILGFIKRFNSGMILFLLNTWKCRDIINKYLKPDRYILGFPHMVGGEKKENEIDTIIFNDGSTRIENVKDKARSKQVKSIFDILITSGLKPKFTQNIHEWIISHHIQQASGVGLFIKYGGPENVISYKTRIKEMILTAREGLKVCKKLGINPLFISPINILYLPLFIIVPLFQKMFHDEDELKMIKGHYAHGKYEMIYGWKEILETANMHNVKVPRWESYSAYINSELEKHLA